MGIRRTEEFRSEAVRIAFTSGLSLKQVSADLGIGLSTLGKWIAARKRDNLMSACCIPSPLPTLHLIYQTRRAFSCLRLMCIGFSILVAQLRFLHFAHFITRKGIHEN